MQQKFYDMIGINQSSQICKDCPKGGLFGANMCIPCAKKYCASNLQYCGQNCPGCRAIVFLTEERYVEHYPRVACAYFLAGCCKKGEKCLFVHVPNDRSDSLWENVSEPPFKICTYFLRGNCKFGAECHNVHPKLS
jgi:hypothetical protein